MAKASTPVPVRVSDQPTRIEPQLDAQGQPTEQNPPCAGRWLRQQDGGLLPADADTAAAAGLAWAPAGPA